MLRKIVTSRDGKLRGCWTPESSVAKFVGWTDDGRMLVWYRGSGSVYVFHGVDSELARSCARSRSVGRHLVLKFRGKYEEVKVA